MSSLPKIKQKIVAGYFLLAVKIDGTVSLALLKRKTINYKKVTLVVYVAHKTSLLPSRRKITSKREKVGRKMRGRLRSLEVK